MVKENNRTELVMENISKTDWAAGGEEQTSLKHPMYV